MEKDNIYIVTMGDYANVGKPQEVYVSRINVRAFIKREHAVIYRQKLQKVLHRMRQTYSLVEMTPNSEFRREFLRKYRKILAKESRYRRVSISVAPLTFEL